MMHYNSKTGQSSIASDQSKQSKLLLLPGVTAEEPRANSRKRLVTALRSANPRVDIHTILDIMYESIFGMTADELRCALDLTPRANLRKALARTTPIGYGYLCFAEEALREAIQKNILANGSSHVKLTDIHAEAVALGRAYTRQIGDFMKYLGMNVVTGQHHNAGLTPDDLEDEDDPF